MERKKITKGRIVFLIVALTVLIIYASCILVPMVWALINTFKSELDYSYYPVGFPKKQFGGWITSNYYIALKIFYVAIELPDGGTRYVEFLELFFNSIVFSTMCMFVSLFSHVIMAYCCCKFKCGYTKFIYKMVIVILTLPIVGNLASEIQVAKAVGVYDNLFGICIMKGGFFSMYFLIFYAVFSGIPDAYREAAQLDGAGHWTILFKIILPMASATIFAIGFLSLISYWNEYQTAMIYLPSHPTIGYGLFVFERNSIKYNTIPVRLTASFMVASPLLIGAIVFRKKIIGSMTMGGLKG